jgi:DNA processing protein
MAPRAGDGCIGRPRTTHIDDTFDLLTVALLPAVGARKVRDLCARGPLAEALRAASDHADLLGDDGVRRVLSGEARRAAETEQARAIAAGVRVLGRDEPDYPQLLRRVFDPPPVLWVRGALPEDGGARSLAVVGSRGASAAGRTLARAIARDLAVSGAVIVSGLARGIDTAAHQGALDAAGATVAVLGSGLDRLYPPENRALADRIVAEGGAIVSEQPQGAAPLPAQFPSRNRIIAGWGVGVVVVEAALRSGALGTARAALDEGREVMAVPGHPLHELSAGTNQLLKDGAALVRHAQDVAAELGWSAALPASRAAADPVLGALQPGQPMDVLSIGVRSGLETPAVLARLTELEIESRVRRLPGALYILR